MKHWDLTSDGKQVDLITLKNGKGMEVDILTYGAILRAIRVPAKDGSIKDVILGYDNMAGYESGTCYFGAVIGRNANRIAMGQVTLDGITYKLPQNDGNNNLHSGPKSIEAEVWKVEEESAHQVKLSIVSPDGASGFPGNISIAVTYTLTEDNKLTLSYEAESDKTTVCNLTNHVYFNLNGQESGIATSQKVCINADKYTPVVAGAIPTSELADVAGTPMDLRSLTEISAMINDDFEQLKLTGGYDHNWVVNGEGMRVAAKAVGEQTDIYVLCETDLPGVQFYAGNYVGEQAGKDGAVYGYRHGYCFETQYFPNAANQEGFKKPILKAGEKFTSVTSYQFGTM